MDFDDAIKGSSAANTLVGGTGKDKLTGLAGADTLQGGSDDDLLDGGDGIDTIDYDGPAAVTVNLSTLTASGGDAQGDVIGAGIENIRGTGIYNDILTGSAVANVLDGYGGNDTLNGMTGNDILVGGAGADGLDGGDGADMADYSGGVAGVTVNLAAGAGSGGDAAGDTLAGIENVKGSLYQDTLTGDGAANVLQGLLGDDVLRGGAEADTLQGGSGFDTASYYSGAARVLVSLVSGIGSGGGAQGDTLSGIENLSGSQGNDSLYGNAGVNVLQGWNGNDDLIGRAGKDTLTGGAGEDRFIFAAVGDSVVGADADIVTDFSRAQGDRIDLMGIDANGSAAGDQAFSFIGSALYTGVAGQLRYAFTAPGVTTIAGDVDGDKVSDFHIQLTGAIDLVASDFML
ncbi:calcium-binding protein [Mycobacterium sp. KBS0706]|uniref:calcium-binding protein n=1 Tax=Mycobacterium sp. KBS0706 TaxID=2578109 RepID=UPI00163DCFA5|nr:calcium-binding protein [Mycobacterium sp. KBS0706]